MEFFEEILEEGTMKIKTEIEDTFTSSFRYLFSL